MPSKKIRIFVDAEVLVADHFSGIGHYTLDLLHGLDRLLDTRSDVEVYLGVYYKQVTKLRSYRFRNFKTRRTFIPLRISNGLKMHGFQPWYDLFFGKFIYFFPNYTTWPLLFSKSVSVVYDLSFEYYPQYVHPANQRFLSKQVRKTIERSAKIITISKNSQKEILEFYNIPKSKTAIVYPGIDQKQLFRWPEDAVAKVKARYGIYGKYILFVGNIEPRKNLKNLLLAYEKLDEDLRKEYSLLLVGARGWLDDEIFEIIERLRVAGNFIQQPLSYVKDEDRAALYSGSSMFVYPSQYEGFGIPPVEAMACGVPVISSDNSSLPEAVGDGAEMVSADSVDQLTRAMAKVLKDKDLQKQMIKKGFLQADKFNWDEEAKKLLDAFEEVARG